MKKIKLKSETGKLSPQPVKSANSFPVVGVGASAGGLEAFKKLLTAIPEDSGMAYVLVQHLHPGHESMLPEILQRVTKIPVLEISDDIKVIPDHIYIIPSNKILVATDGVLQLSPRPPLSGKGVRGEAVRNLPVDIFFSSLAEVHQAHSIGVVLSGTASDGTLGLKAIKDHGGITFAQEESSAAYDGMPHSAIQAGVVDFILPAEKIVAKIIELTKITHGNGNGEQEIPESQETVFKQMLSLLRMRKGMDFTYYKQSTIHRRILRRMALNKTENPATYLKYLKENKPEQDVLFQDLLIPVTSFFRDPKTFDNICSTVFPKLIKNKGTEPIRIWVAGCSTGEEVYSMAICLKEYLLHPDNNRDYKENGFKRLSDVSFQLFATDISEPAIAKARAGLYTKADVLLLSEERLSNFFTKSNGSYLLNKSIREACVFAKHNYLIDPPFGKMDLISCRNSLIYMEPYLQKKALTTFHYALNPNGYLLLGKSETISQVPGLFAAAIKHDKLFIRKDQPGKFIPSLTRTKEQDFNSTNSSSIPFNQDKNIRTDFQQTADEIMLLKYSPAGVVVNEAMDIVHFRGNTSSYLQQSTGKPSHNLLKMAKNGLAFELRNLVHKAKKEHGTVMRENIPILNNGDSLHITIEAIPLPNMAEPHYLILFHERQAADDGRQTTAKRKLSVVSGQSLELRVEQLERELAQAREDMRSITEDQEAANEELQSANEELVSGSEELQSMNEELETGKEELQSTNEELTVVNQELISMNEQATEAREFSDAIISSLHEPLLVLDKNLRIKLANSTFYKTFQVNEAETQGKLIYELGNHQWNIPGLRNLLEKILPEKSRFTGYQVSHRFPSIGERTMLLNAREMINESQGEKLILLAIEDTTERMQAEQNTMLLSNIVEYSNDAIISKTLHGIISIWNKGAELIFGYSAQEAVGKSISLLIPPELMPEEEMIIGKIKKGREVQHYETIRLAKNGARLNISVTVSPLKDAAGKITGVSTIARDVTQQHIILSQVKESEEKFSALADNMENLAWLANGDGWIHWYNKRWYEYTGTALEEMKGWGWEKVHHPDHIKRVVDFVTTAWKKNEPWELTFPLLGSDGVYRWFLTRAFPITNQAGEILRWIGTNTDIDEQKKKEVEIKYRKALLEAHNQSSVDGILLVDAKGKIISYNHMFIEIWNMPQDIVDAKDDEAALGFAMKQLVHPQQFIEKVKWLYNHPTEKSVDELEFKDGKIVERHGYPVIADDGSYYAWSWTFRDITTQKLAEIKVRESESELRKTTEHFQIATSAAEVGTWSLDLATETIVWSSLHKKMWGYDENRTDLHYEDWHKIILTGDKEHAFAEVEKARKTRSVYEAIYRIKRPDNEYIRWIRSTGQYFYNEAGEAVTLTGVSMDITEQKQAEIALQASEEHFRQLANMIPDKITTADATGIVNYYNQNWIDFTGRSFKNLINEGWGKSMHPDEVEELKIKWQQSLESGNDLETEVQILDKHGAYKWHLTRASAVKDEDGKVIKWIGCMTEIQKIKEEEQRKDDFLKMVSHELKTPVTSVKGYVQLLLHILKEKQETPSAFLETPLLRIDNQVGRLGKLISEMLDLSRLNSGKLEMEKETFSLQELVSETVEDISFTNDNHTIHFSGAHTAKVFGDRNRIGQVIINLLNNAIKYSPEKDRIDISMYAAADDKVAVTITDYGIGIDKAHQQKIFERFYRAGGESEKNYAGFGIGLFIAAEIIERHGGTIAVQSEIDKGAAFTFSLPLAPAKK